ncbi:barstar family protein [Terrarubrum flagellatum]|uniref:barstar family protein n=1 Tax=Terrirubrum flagellatum TaxID=2895980 RepID=UPI003144EFED
MRVIQLDASGSGGSLDFTPASLVALGAPSEHGRNLNALIDSMIWIDPTIWGGINSVQPPYLAHVLNMENAGNELQKEIEAFARAFREAKAEFRLSRGYDAQTYFEIGLASSTRRLLQMLAAMTQQRH